MVTSLVPQWQEAENKPLNPRQKSLRNFAGAFLFPIDMRKLFITFFLMFIACSDFGTNPKEEENSGKISYKNDIQPMLNASCVNCHPNNGRLSVRTYENLMKGTSNNGPIVIPNNGSGSLIIKKLQGTASGDRMPPEPASKWSDSKIELVKNWIDQGALNN